MGVSDLTPFQAAKPYLTVIPSRHPHEKLHETLGQARAAIGNAGRYSWHKGGKIYGWDEAERDWVLLYEMSPDFNRNGRYFVGPYGHKHPWQK